jgi:hypothetical protein
MQTKKAQAAMEFLMTYGWALLGVMAAVAALAYFGVLTPTKYLPESCILGTGIACIDFTVHTTEINLFLTNSLGKDITIQSITVGSCNQSFNTPLSSGSQYLFNIPCNAGVTGESYRGDITISYDSGTLTKTHLGKLIAHIQ